jgi:thioredoxin 1
MKKKKLKIIPILFIFHLLACCNQAQINNLKELDAKTFKSVLDSTPEVQLVDVRTPEEFKKEHLHNALNININGNEFEQQISALDKDKPVFVYCLSGGRSSSAADYMRSNGFLKVYELEGGILKWTAKNLPTVSIENNSSSGITEAEYNSFLSAENLVLIDFNAKWCAPCKKMAPYLEEISIKYKGKLNLIKIDIDENPAIAKKMNIESLPVLILYKNKNQVWLKKGLSDKEEIEQVVISNL